MVQITVGVKLGYATARVDEVIPTYTYLPNITGIPALGSTPSTHNVTDLSNTQKVYIAGLTDNGGNLDFPCNFTKEILTAVETAMTAQKTATQEWCVEFPAPLAKRCYFEGTVSQVYNSSADVDTPLTGTLSIIPSTELLWEDIV